MENNRARPYKKCVRTHPQKARPRRRAATCKPLLKAGTPGGRIYFGWVLGFGIFSTFQSRISLHIPHIYISGLFCKFFQIFGDSFFSKDSEIYSFVINFFGIILYLCCPVFFIKLQKFMNLYLSKEFWLEFVLISVIS